MQSNVQQTTVHIKIQFRNEIRRFSLSTPSFALLESTVRDLFELSSEFKVRYLDDEEDWVTISNNSEFAYAVELSSLLRLSITLKEEETTPVSFETSEPEQFGKCRRGRGRGGRGKAGKPWNANLSPQERLDKKTSRLTERIATLEEKMKDETIPKDRVRVLVWRLQNLKEKLESVNADRSTLESTGSLPDHFGHRGPHGHGGRGCGRGRGARGRGHCQKWKEEPQNGSDQIEDSPTPHNDSPVFQCKTNLIAARKSGNKDEIETCRLALKLAKQERKNTMSPEKRELIKTKRAQVQQCKSDLITARKEGRKDDIPALFDALQEAKEAFRDAKFNF